MTFPIVSVESQLASARQQLLDLGLRNPLVNYRSLKSKTVAIVDERAAEVFRILVTEGRAMSFQPSAEDDYDEGLLPPPEPDGTIAARHRDTKLQTALSPARLQSTLLNIHYTARTHIEEQGVNVLFLALGMLHWSENDGDSDLRRAPLLLIPIELNRASAQDRFQVRYTGEDLGTNLSLEAKLNAEFSLRLPSLADGEELDVNAYMEQVKEAISAYPDWKVVPDELVIGFFSFGKFLMFNDLDSETWPDEGRPEDHPLLRALLKAGFSEPPSLLSDEDHLDDHLAPQDIPCVLPADSSQTLAILDAAHGRTFVIQGPPGTGKSQTITNLIADAIGRGKTVLFVSEKMAALEVVKRRLDMVGLGDACLELHSHKTNKKTLLQELSRTLNLGRPRSSEVDATVSQVAELRLRLNQHAEALNMPLGQTGVTPYEAQGEVLVIRQEAGDAELPRIDLSELARRDRASYLKGLDLVSDLQNLLKRLGLPSQHAFWGSRLAALLPGERQGLAESLRECLAATQSLAIAGVSLASDLQLPTPVTSEDVTVLIACARRLAEAPDLVGFAVDAPEWVRRQEEIQELLVAGEAYEGLLAKRQEQVIPYAWKQDLTLTRQHLAAHGGKWWKFLIGDYRRAKATLVGNCREGLPRTLAEQLTLLDDILEAQALKERLQEGATLLDSLLGDTWKQKPARWKAFRDAARWLSQLHADIGAGMLPEVLLERLMTGRPGSSKADAAEAARARQQGARNVLNERLCLDSQLLPPSLGELQARLSRMEEGLEELELLVSFNQLADPFEQGGLATVYELAKAWPAAPHRLVLAYRLAYMAQLLDLAHQERPILGKFEGGSHEQAISRFQELDGQLMNLNRVQLAQVHHQRMPRPTNASGQMGVITHEIQKKARHLPIRQLMLRAGTAIQSIKPIFMMSPLSIATYLPPGALVFDMVVFDEASQVKPVDAFGALLRARQAVVVGDSKQMPPTNFFDSLTAEGDGEGAADDIESVLGLFEAQGAPSRMLRWHYRSRHESLIAVSNREFYENRLVVFPSPDGSRSQVGLIYHHLPQATYDRGDSAVNREEAKAVARAVLEHARRSPGHTLGVVAFSIGQTHAIQEHLEELRRRDVSGEAFFAAHPHEPFFVKNLENVQGDERDVILISIGYGWDASRKLSLNFGPLNRDGGERRLNVLISRARMRCEVYTNLRADDLDLSRSSARGVSALKSFLEYAEKGEPPRAAGSDASPEPAFTRHVAGVLQEAGYQVSTQVGESGISLDLAVHDPQYPGRFALGVQCDGPSYTVARSARDRDLLRPGVLRALDWRLHAVWSVDWTRKPQTERRRLLAAVESALSEALPAPRVAVAEIPPEIVREEEAAPAETLLPLPLYRFSNLAITLADQELHLMPLDRLARWMVEIVEVEGPILEVEVFRRLREAAGVKRLGSRIQARFEEARQFAVRAAWVIEREGFLSMPDGREPVLRDRSSAPPSLRKLEAVANEELVLAVLRALEEAVSLERDQIPVQVCRILGLGKPSEDQVERFDTILGTLLTVDKVRVQGKSVTRKAPPVEVASEKISLPAPAATSDSVGRIIGGVPESGAAQGPDWYALIGVERTASAEEIRQAYVKTAMLWMRKKNAATTPEARLKAEQMERLLQEAKQELLSSP